MVTGAATFAFAATASGCEALAGSPFDGSAQSRRDEAERRADGGRAAHERVPHARDHSGHLHVLALRTAARVAANGEAALGGLWVA